MIILDGFDYTYIEKNLDKFHFFKNLYDNKPSNDDLRQMFAYLHYYNAKKTALLYPNDKELTVTGEYYKRIHDSKDEECSLLKIPVERDIKKWKANINTHIENWISI